MEIREALDLVRAEYPRSEANQSEAVAKHAAAYLDAFAKRVRDDEEYEFSDREAAALFQLCEELRFAADQFERDLLRHLKWGGGDDLAAGLRDRRGPARRPPGDAEALAPADRPQPPDDDRGHATRRGGSRIDGTTVYRLRRRYDADGGPFMRITSGNLKAAPRRRPRRCTWPWDCTVRADAARRRRPGPGRRGVVVAGGRGLACRALHRHRCGGPEPGAPDPADARRLRARVFDVGPKNPNLLQQALSLSEHLVVPVRPTGHDLAELGKVFDLAADADALSPLTAELLLVDGPAVGLRA
ncbi:ParA family protein [Pseudonocardia sp. Ae707_Ps1]|uniref:ParA family protein n=1 Tax=Pseudonocardia sp. Ae707_Ps1 TaxID=1885572 RepID=UPI000A8FBCF0|nr:ParA family protein [Pseudonocardia sp. Ae707_Ps1]